MPVAFYRALDAMPGEVEAGYFQLQSDFCRMGQEYLLGVEFADLKYGSVEGFRSSISHNQVKDSNPDSDAAWRSDLLRIIEMPDCQHGQTAGSSGLSEVPSFHNCVEEQPSNFPRLQNVEKFHDSPSSSQNNELRENDGSVFPSTEILCHPSMKKYDESEPTGQELETDTFHGHEPNVSANESCNGVLLTQKRSRKPTKRYIEELTYPISSRKRQAVSSLHKNNTLDVKDHQKCRVGSGATRLPTVEPDVIAIQVPFGSILHNECPKEQSCAMVQHVDTRNLMTTSKGKQNQKKRNEHVAAVRVKTSEEHSVCQKKRDACVPTAQKSKINDCVIATSPKKRKDLFVDVTPRKRDDCVATVHEKICNESAVALTKRDACVPLSHKSKYDYCVTAASPKKRNHYIVDTSPSEKDDRAGPTRQKKRLDCLKDTKQKETDCCLPAESSEEVSCRRKHHTLWSISEVRKLVDGVAKYGVGRWSRIKKLFFSASAHRTSVDLKDKWRNLLKASGIPQQGSRQGGGKKRSAPWRPLPKPILRRVCELAARYPYPKGPTEAEAETKQDPPPTTTRTMAQIHQEPQNTSTDITLNDYKRILRSINDD